MMVKATSWKWIDFFFQFGLLWLLLLVGLLPISFSKNELKESLENCLFQCNGVVTAATAAATAQRFVLIGHMYM